MIDVDAPSFIGLGALPLAVERVNADPALLAGKKLQYVWRNSQCSASAALLELGSLTSEGIHAILGPGSVHSHARICMHTCVHARTFFEAHTHLLHTKNFT
jgi:hypothetical protein